MHVHIFCFVVLSMNLPVQWTSPISKFMLIRKRKCIIGGDSSRPGVLQLRRQHKIDFDMIKKHQANMPETDIGPERGKDYDPTGGYEQYWAEGIWILSPQDPDFNINGKEEEEITISGKPGSNKKKPKQKTKRTKDPDAICGGFSCTNMYKVYGPICATDRDLNNHNFSNYCEMKRADCDNDKELMIAHRGWCIDAQDIVPTHSAKIIENAAKYAKDFEEKYGKPIN